MSAPAISIQTLFDCALAARAYALEVRDGLAARWSTDGKLDRKALDQDQHAAHGLAWIATYA